MRKTGVILLSFFIFILSGCTSHKPPEPQMDFTASVLISQGDNLTERSTFQAQLTSASQGMITLRLEGDDALNNLQYKWDDKLTVSYRDMYLVTETGYLPHFSFAQCIYNVLCDLPRNGEFMGFEGETAVFSGETRSGRYKVETDPKGNIFKISVEELNLVIDLGND